jgi:hypothetical protein
VTTLAAASAPAVIMPVGGYWAARFVTYDVDGYASGEVTPTVVLTKPDASTLPVVPVYEGSGLWGAVYTTTSEGRHIMAASTPQDTLLLAAYVDMVTTEAGMPTAADVSVYLGTYAGTWSMTEIGDALAAERAAQRARCGERAIYPDDLRQALLRRCQRNLAMRRHPLAVMSADVDGGSTVLPGKDPEVRRLEAPFRRLVVG